MTKRKRIHPATLSDGVLRLMVNGTLYEQELTTRASESLAGAILAIEWLDADTDADTTPELKAAKREARAVAIRVLDACRRHCVRLGSASRGEAPSEALPGPSERERKGVA